MDIFAKIADSFIQNEIISSEDKDLYIYGLKQGIFMVISIGTTVIISIILRMLWQSSILMLAYIPLRTFSGGYHARTQLRCYIISTAIISITLIGIKFIPWTNFICFSIALFSGSIIFFLAPVEDSNKPLSLKEIIIYRKKSLIILSILLGITLMLYILKFIQIIICITMAISLCAVMLVVGKLKNK